jgi:tetratricopeptide (TPR) repeat protein
MASFDPPPVIDTAFRGVFHDACDFVVGLPPGDAFRPKWYRAAVAALAGGQPGRGRAALDERGDRPGILIRDASRFVGHVDPGRMALAATLAVEALAWSQLYQRDATVYTAASTSPEFGARIERSMARFLPTSVNRAVASLKRAETVETARAEALLRRGALVAAAGNPQESLMLFDESLSLADDEWVTYLAHLLRGRALESLQRVEQAESAFRMALVVGPRAHSANLALAANLFARGIRADAAAGLVLDPAAQAPDPWAQFENGDYRFWPARRADLRKAMQ